MGINGVIFDFNGTLFWDTSLHNRAWDIFFEKHGISLSDKDKYEKLHGKNNKDILNTLFPGQFTDVEIEKLSTEKEEIYQRICLQTDMQLAPGAEEFLYFLLKVHIPFTLATASTLINIDFYFNHLGLDSFFDRSKVVFNDGHTLSKPDPHIFQKAMDNLGIKGSETLVFEDSVSGITAAENAGVTKIIIVDSNGDDYDRWDYQKIENFKEVDRKLFHHSSQH
jgi:beta-phosphoglucomutase